MPLRSLFIPPGLPAQLIGLVHGRGVPDVARVIGVGAKDHAALHGLRHAAGEAPEGRQHGLSKGIVRRGAGDKEAEGLSRQLGVEGVRPVQHRLQLGGHGVEVDGGGQDDDVRRQHGFPDLRHVAVWTQAPPLR